LELGVWGKLKSYRVEKLKKYYSKKNPLEIQEDFNNLFRELN
jgi:hypothetical protein